MKIAIKNDCLRPKAFSELPNYTYFIAADDTEYGPEMWTLCLKIPKVTQGLSKRDPSGVTRNVLSFAPEEKPALGFVGEAEKVIVVRPAVIVLENFTVDAENV